MSTLDLLDAYVLLFPKLDSTTCQIACMTCPLPMPDTTVYDAKEIILMMNWFDRVLRCPDAVLSEQEKARQLQLSSFKSALSRLGDPLCDEVALKATVTCPKCPNSTDIIQMAKSLRSMDEGAIAKYQCSACGTHF